MDSQKSPEMRCLHQKQQWLESVRFAREQYVTPEAAIIMESPLVRATMWNWLFQHPTNEDDENPDSEESDGDSD